MNIRPEIPLPGYQRHGPNDSLAHNHDPNIPSLFCWNEFLDQEPLTSIEKAIQKGPMFFHGINEEYATTLPTLGCLYDKGKAPEFCSRRCKIGPVTRICGLGNRDTAFGKYLEGKKLVSGQKNGLKIVDDRNTKEFQMTYHRERVLLDGRSQPRQDHIGPKASSHMIYPQSLIIYPHKYPSWMNKDRLVV